MGLNIESPSSNVLALTVDANGAHVAFDAVVRHGENAAKIVYSTHADLVPKIAAAACDHEDEDDDEDEDEEATAARTRAAVRVIVNARLSAVQPASVRKFIKYKPARQSSAAFNSGAEERVVRVEHAQEDPVLPPKHKRRLVPRLPGSPPVTAMHSPPRRGSCEDMEGWKIPPCVSDCKNNQGYSVPLDKRVASDGRRMMQDDVEVSGGFASVSEALYVAEQKAREAIKTRDKVRRELLMKEVEHRERMLREIANQARAAAAAPAAAPVVDAEDARMQRERDMVREELRHQRASSGKRSRVTRDMDRDVSERIALGMASTGAAGEVTYDERLFNQSTGMDSGFAADDVYNVYSGRLFAAQPAALSALYRPSKSGDSDIYGDADEQLERISKTDRFKPDKGFSGTAVPPDGKRERPVEFDTSEESAEAYDPFVELDRYMDRVKEGKKN